MGQERNREGQTEGEGFEAVFDRRQDAGAPKIRQPEKRGPILAKVEIPRWQDDWSNLAVVG